MLSCCQSLVQSQSSCHNSHLVVFALVHHLGRAVLIDLYLFSTQACPPCCAPHLSLAHVEVLVAVVDDGAVLAAGADVANTLMKMEMKNTVSGTQTGAVMHVCLTYLSARSQLHGLLCGHAVAGVEYGCRGNGPEHGHVLQAHQRWALFSCRTSTAFHI